MRRVSAEWKENSRGGKQRRRGSTWEEKHECVGGWKGGRGGEAMLAKDDGEEREERETRKIMIGEEMEAGAWRGVKGRCGTEEENENEKKR